LQVKVLFNQVAIVIDYGNYCHLCFYLSFHKTSVWGISLSIPALCMELEINSNNVLNHKTENGFVIGPFARSCDIL